MYRPQYAYPSPPAGWEDEQFHYSFDSTNTPLLALAIAAGEQSNNIMLPMQQDAPFICRAIKIQGLGTEERAGLTAASTLSVQLRTPHGDYIETVYVPLALWAFGGGLAVAGRMVIPIEPEVECPAGSTWTLFLSNPTGGSVLPPAVTLLGIKRRRCDDVKRRAA